MIEFVPLTDGERALLISSHVTRTELAKMFGCSVATVKRARQKIRAHERDVYLWQPPMAVRVRLPRYTRKTTPATPREVLEGPLGEFPDCACEGHLEDLKRWHKPLASRQRMSRFAPLRLQAL